MIPAGPMTKTETKRERKRTTTTKRNTSNSSYLVEEVTQQPKSFPWALNRLLFLRMRHLKWMRIFKKGFFLGSGMKLKFLLSTGIN